MPFEMFVRRSRPTTTQPVVGIQNRGTISFNQSAFAMLSERMPKGAKGEVYAQLFYDRERQVVAFKAVTETADNAYIVRKQPNAASYIMTGKGFLGYFGLMSETLRRYHLRQLDNGLVGFSMVEDELGQQQDEEEPQGFVQAPPARGRAARQRLMVPPQRGSR